MCERARVVEIDFYTEINHNGTAEARTVHTSPPDTTHTRVTAAVIFAITILGGFMETKIAKMIV